MKTNKDISEFFGEEQNGGCKKHICLLTSELSEQHSYEVADAFQMELEIIEYLPYLLQVSGLMLEEKML